MRRNVCGPKGVCHIQTDPASVRHHDHEISAPFPSALASVLRSLDEYSRQAVKPFCVLSFLCLFALFSTERQLTHVSFTVYFPFFFPCGEGGMRLDASVSQQYLEDYLSYSENMLNKCQLHDMWQTKMACRRRNAGSSFI